MSTVTAGLLLVVEYSNSFTTEIEHVGLLLLYDQFSYCF